MKDLDGWRKNWYKFKQEHQKVLIAWKYNLTDRGLTHKWVDIWVTAARVSPYWIGKVNGVGIPVVFLVLYLLMHSAHRLIGG